MKNNFVYNFIINFISLICDNSIFDKTFVIFGVAMPNKRNIIFYVFIVLVCTLGVWGVLRSGQKLEIEKSKQGIVANNFSKYQSKIFDENPKSSLEMVENQFFTNLKSPISILFIQIIAIIVVSRIFSYLLNKIGQPNVIGEILAGIALGPSLLGAAFPHTFEFLFPSYSLSNLEFLAQLGLILFMFVIGMELDTKLLKNKAKEAVIISHASIVVPYFLGVILAYNIYTNYAPAQISFIEFALFIGIAMSITAFPVLARIIHERNMTKTYIGSMVITCAAADDVSAWCILAAVIAIVKAGTLLSAFFTILLTVIFVCLMLYVVKPWIKSWSNTYIDKPDRSKYIIAMVFVLLLVSSFTTELIGIHALFGAFIAGVIIPDDLNFKKLLVKRVEDVSLILLLPLFFVYTGLRTEIGLLFQTQIWQIGALVTLVAIVGKFGGSALAARYMKLNWKDSAMIGVFMNTRGLMELIVLNIGYNLGILTTELFTVFVIMALVTTMMTGPAIDLISYLFKNTSSQEIPIPEEVYTNPES